MIRVNVSLDIDAARASFADYSKQVDSAAAKALNRTADAAKSEADRAIRSRTKLKQADIRKRIWVNGASPSRLEATVNVMPFAPNLRYFSHSPSEPGHGRNIAGVSATAWANRAVYRGSFVLPSGKIAARVGKDRANLKKLFGPSLPNTFMKPPVLRQVLARVYEVWPRQFADALAYRIPGA